MRIKQGIFPSVQKRTVGRNMDRVRLTKEMDALPVKDGNCITFRVPKSESSVWYSRCYTWIKGDEKYQKRAATAGLKVSIRQEVLGKGVRFHVGYLS